MLIAMTKKDPAPERNEGQMLRALLDSHGLEDKVLAGPGRDKTAVSKWMKRPKFNNRQWLNVRDAWQKAGLPMHELRAIKDDPIQMNRERATDLDETAIAGRLRSEISNWKTDHLTTVRDILRASEESRKLLLFWLDDIVGRAGR